MTKVWPMAATARTEAKEKTLSEVLRDTLPGARSGLIRKRSKVAGTMKRNSG